MSDTAARLREAIVEFPQDLMLRQIYADQLLELGDPWGELISLQIANRDPARVAALIAEHGRRWIGPLEPWVRFEACVFSDGFLSEVVVLDPGRLLTPLVGNAIWSTVRGLHLGRVDHVRGGPRPVLRAVAALIAHPIMRSLVSVTVGPDREGLMIEREPDGSLAFVPRFG